MELPSDFGMEGIVEMASSYVVAGDYLVVRIDDGNLEVDGDELLGERSFYGEVSPGDRIRVESRTVVFVNDIQRAECPAPATIRNWMDGGLKVEET